MKISSKLYGLTTFFALALLSLSVVGWNVAENLYFLKDDQNLVNKLEIKLLNLRRNEKDFLARFDAKYVDKFNKNISDFDRLLDELETKLVSVDIKLSEIKNVNSSMKSYHQGFIELSQGYEKLGLKENQGLRGELSKINQEIISEMPSNQVIKYLGITNNLAVNQTTKNNIDEYNRVWDRVSTNYQFALLNKQRQLTQQIIKEKTRLGLDHKSGLLGEIRNKTHKVEADFVKMRKVIQTDIASVTKTIVLKVVLMFLFTLTFVLVFSFNLSRHITQRLASFSDLMSQIVREKNLAIRANVKGSDEISTLGNNLNSMLSSWQDIIANVKNSINHLNVTATDLQASSSHVEKALIQQHTDSDMAVTAVHQMEATIKEISVSTNTAAKNANQSVEKAQEASENYQNTRNYITTLSSGLEATSQEINHLVSLSQKIGSVVDVIKDISEQTNLLALNAAIEAARAGEQGRGFAVVADEVRSLATRTYSSTDEIAEIIGSLQKRTDKAMERINRCQTDCEQSVESVELGATELNNIITDMNQIMDMSIQISAAIEQQSMVAKEVHQNVASIQGVTASNTTATGENAQAAIRVAGQCHDLEKAIAIFK